MRRFLYIFIAVLFLVLLALVYWTGFTSVVTGSEEQVHVLKIRSGMGFNQIIALMQKQNMIQGDIRLKITGQVLGLRSKIKAGKYEIPGGLSSYEVLNKLARGDIAVERVTFREGIRTQEIAAILKERVEIDSTRFMQLVEDSAFARQLKVPAPRLEGFLFPETYGLYWGMQPADIIRIMVSHFQARFTDSLRQRASDLDFSVLEIVTLASIIEGEAVFDSERRIISAVYHNRLKKGMLLQADPTIQYIIQDAPRRVLNRDLKIDSPYNTYKYSGLPPGPINNPGLASLEAALDPAEVDYLFFVANGDGSHSFSVTLSEHLKAKARFDRFRKEIERQKRGEGNGD